MKSLIDLKKELIDGKVSNLNIFVGEENLIRKIYYEKISEYAGDLKYLESVKDLFKELEKKSLFKKKYTYVIYNDLDFPKQKETILERLLSLSANNTVVLVYDELPDRDLFRKIFDSYITTFNYVTDDVAMKYVSKMNKSVSIDLARRIVFNSFNSYNNIVEEMNKYNHYVNNVNDDAIDALTYAAIFTDRKDVPSTQQFANAFITNDISKLVDYYKIIKANSCNILGYLPELYNTVVLSLYIKIYGKWDGGGKAYNAGEYWGRIKELRDFHIPYNKDDLLDIRYLLYQLDMDVRSGKMKAEYAWEWLIGVIL